MVERIALSAVILVGVFAVFLGVPRYVTDGDGWPDVLGGLDSVAQSWIARPRFLDWGVALIGVVLLGVGVSVFRGAGIVDGTEIIGWALLAVGFVALYAGTYVSVRRSGVSSAEATLIGTTLIGVVLLVAILAVLLNI